MFLASGGKQIIFYDSNYEVQQQYGNFDEAIRPLDWSYDSQYMVTVTATGQAQILRPNDVETKRIQRVNIVNCSAATFYKQTNHYIAAGTSAGVVKVWDTRAQKVCKEFTPLNSSVTSLDVCCADTYMAVGGERSEVDLYGIISNVKMDRLKLPNSKGSVTSVHFSPISRSALAATTESGSLAVWDILKKKTPLKLFNDHHSICSDMTFSGLTINVMITVGYDKLINMYDTRLPKPVCVVHTPYPLTSISTSPDGYYAACGHRQGGVVVYDMRNIETAIAYNAAHDGAVTSVRYKPLHECRGNSSIESSIEDNRYSETPMQTTTRAEQTEDSFLKMIGVSPNSTNTNQKAPTFKKPRDSFFLDVIGEGYATRSSLTGASTSATSLEEPHQVNTPESLSPSVAEEDEEEANDLTATPHESNIEDMFADLPNLSNLSNLVESGTASILESIKFNTFDLMQFTRVQLMSLYISMCKQHLAVVDRLDELRPRTDDLDLRNENDRLKRENKNLQFEVNYLRKERAKYMPRDEFL